MLKSVVLQYLDGDFVIITPPPILDGNGQFHARLVRLYHVELQASIAGRAVWPVEQVGETIFLEHRRKFEKVAGLLNPVVNASALDPVSRHNFFVCTEPINHPQTGELVPGLSQLEQLMGYTYPSGEAVAEPVNTTGDTELDVLIDALLIFKRHGVKMAQLLGLEDLSKAARQANERMRPPDETASAPQEKWEDSKDYLEQKDEIESKLSAMGISIPEI